MKFFATVSITMILIAAVSCEHQPSSVANWDKSTTPVFTRVGGVHKEIATWTIWRQGAIEYHDTDQDDQIDYRMEQIDNRQIQWFDTDRDGIFDVEFISIGGNADPNNAKAISVKVPSTK